MDNQTNPRPGTFNVQTPPQVVTITVDPVLLAALASIQTTLGEILAETRATGALQRAVSESQLRMDSFTQDMLTRMAPGSATAAQEAPGQVPMATDHISALDELTGPNNASELSSQETASPDAVIYADMTPAEIYKQIEANWVMNDSGTPVYREADGTIRPLSPAEANAVRANLAKGGKRGRS